jgi:hypothetical protein
MPNPVIEVPLSAAWKALGATDEFDPPALDFNRIFLLADCKTGKTTLVCSHPRCLVLDLELKARSIASKRAQCVPVREYADLERVICQLEADARLLKDKRPFLHVAFDSIDRLQELVAPQLTKEVTEKTNGKCKDIQDYRGGKGGFALINKRVLSFPRRCHKAGYGWTAIGHIKHDKVVRDGREVEFDRPACQPGVAGGITQDAEMLMGLTKITKDMPVAWKKGPDGKYVTKQDGTRQPVAWDRRPMIQVETQQKRPSDCTLGIMIKMPATFTIPVEDGWQEVQRLYEEAVEAKKQELAKQETA